MGGTHAQVEYQSILEPGNITTGVRASLDGTVILTGSKTVEGSTGTEAYLYHGPLNNTAAGEFYVLDPTFAGQTVTTATFYGPDTAIFTPGIGLGNVRAVGSYQYAENPAGVFNHGMIYEGPITGIGGTWTEVTVPSNGVNVVGGVTISGTVANTILHSTQGNLVVGNYDISGPGGILLGANGFIYNIATGQYTLMNVNGSYDNLTSLYGIWQNGVGSDTYTIAGGSKDGTGLNAAFLQTYNAATGEFSNLTFYNGFNKAGGLLTHFENITGGSRRLQSGRHHRQRPCHRRDRAQPRRYVRRRGVDCHPAPGQRAADRQHCLPERRRRHLQHRRFGYGRDLSRRRAAIPRQLGRRADHARRLARLLLRAVGARQHRRHDHRLDDRRQRAGWLDRQRQDHRHREPGAGRHDLYRRRRRHDHPGGRPHRKHPRPALRRQQPHQC
jgi:hypothetical protein